MFFAKLHPLLVHFPVGLLVSGTLFELYGNFQGEKIVAKAGAFNVRFGFWCSLPVALVGFLGVMSIELKDELVDQYGYYPLNQFTSKLNIPKDDSNELIFAIEEVIQSYGEYPSLHNQILIQPQIENVVFSGVMFTCDIRTGAPYKLHVWK